MVHKPNQDNTTTAPKANQSNEILMQTGISLIAAERTRQIEELNRSVDADVMIHTCNELAFAAATYALPEEHRMYLSDNSKPVLFCWDSEAWKPSPNDRVKELQKAGALIAAEIDRLLRLQFDLRKSIIDIGIFFFRAGKNNVDFVDRLRSSEKLWSYLIHCGVSDTHLNIFLKCCWNDGREMFGLLENDALEEVFHGILNIRVELLLSQSKNIVSNVNN